jgi:hypothetical protein
MHIITACISFFGLVEITNMKLILKAGECDSWCPCLSQGKGVEDYRGYLKGNAWFGHPRILHEGQYMEAVKLKSNTTGAWTDLAKLWNNISQCRDCSNCKYTHAQILG